MLVLGVDVAKKELVVSDGSRVWSVPNSRAGTARLLRGLSPETVVAMESTSHFHLPLADMAFEMGFTVYVLNPKLIKRYRDAMPVRGKTDPIDAELIASFALKEHERLVAYRPAPEEQRKLKALILRRSRLTSSKARIAQSLEGCPELRAESKAILSRIDKAMLRIDELIQNLASSERYERLQQIPGVGKLTGAGILVALSHGEFRSADAFVAFIGLDLVANDSGTKKGKRRLSKLGDAETRRLTFMCAMAAIRTPAWKPVYEQYRTRYSTIGALVALSRRIVRTAWSMDKHQTDFVQTRIQEVDKKP